MNKILALILAYRYPIILPFAILEGPIVTVIAGFLVSIGIMNPLAVYGIVVLGDAIGDTFYYALGYWGREFIMRHGRRFGVTKEKMDKANDYFKENHGKALVLSKLVHGIGTTGLVAAGSLKISYRRFFTTCFLITMVQSAFFLILGIFFGGAYMQIARYLKEFAVIISAVALAVVVIIFYKRTNIKKNKGDEQTMNIDHEDNNITQRKLNIAMVCDAIDYQIGGSPVSTLRFSERLVGRGHTVIYIAAKTSYASGDVEGIRTYRFRSVLVPHTERKFYLAFPTLAEAKKVLKDERIDVLHIVLPFAAGLVFVKAARSMGIKVVIASHTQVENAFLYVPKILGRALLNRIFIAYLSWIYKKADAMIYPSAFIEFARTQPPQLDTSMRYEAISNGVDTSFFKPQDPAPFFKKYNLSPTHKYLLFVGRFAHPEKDIATLIRALPEIAKTQPAARVLLVGPDSQKQDLVRLAKSLGVEDKVIFTGRISEEDKVLACNACTIFCMPSLAEMEGMVVLEAMACGAPVLIADAPNNASKHFVDKNGLLFKPQDPHDCARQALIMLSDQAALKAMGQQSLENSRNYDINESVVRLENLYYSVLSEKL